MSDLDRLWKHLKDTESSSAVIHFHRNEGDEKPYRLVVVVEGEAEVEEILGALRKLGLTE